MCATAYRRYTYKQPMISWAIRGSYGKNGIATEEQPRYDGDSTDTLRIAKGIWEGLA